MALFGDVCKDVAWNAESHKCLQEDTVDGRPVRILFDRGCNCTTATLLVVMKSKVSLENKLTNFVCSWRYVPLSKSKGDVGMWAVGEENRST